MDSKQAIKEIEELMGDSNYTDVWSRASSEPMNMALDLAIEALEKQIPKKPTDVYISQGKYEWGCSNCEHTLTKYMKFCKYCGQRLDD